MPLTPSALLKLKKPLSFSYLGETINLEYYPAALGDDMRATAKRLTDEAAAADAAGDEAAQQKTMLDTGAWLCSMLASWDFMQEDGVTMQPITPENMATQLEAFPDFISAVVTAIMNERNRGNASGAPSSKNSADTSSTTDSSASTGASPNPSASSSLPDGSEETSPETSTGS